jgi:hypothetical protein
MFGKKSENDVCFESFASIFYALRVTAAGIEMLEN